MVSDSARHAENRCDLTRAMGRRLAVAALASAVWCTASAMAQVNQFGGQDRADAAARMVVLAVQQGINALPPTSAQSVVYMYDRQLDAFVRRAPLGATAFRVPETIGAGNASFRIAASYFTLDKQPDPIDYLVKFDTQGAPAGFGKLGAETSAKVGLVSMTTTYGITPQWELTLSVPVVVVDAHASQIFSTRATDLGSPPNRAVFSGAPTLSELNQALAAHELVLRTERFTDLGFEFDEGTHAGVGRISVGTKGLVYAGDRAQLAATAEFFCPSPNEGEFAGSASAAILPRAVAAFSISERLTLHLDSGYEHDFEHDELRRFVWNAGASFPGSLIAIDVGVGGSKFNQGIQWTPAIARGIATGGFPASTLTAVENTRLGSTFVDFLGGVKFRVSENSVIEGAVSVPVTADGVRPEAVGTVALEFYR
jgi:hypothetical protein